MSGSRAGALPWVADGSVIRSFWFVGNGEEIGGIVFKRSPRFALALMA